MFVFLQFPDYSFKQIRSHILAFYFEGLPSELPPPLLPLLCVRACVCFDAAAAVSRQGPSSQGFMLNWWGLAEEEGEGEVEEEEEEEEGWELKHCGGV